MDRIKSIKLFHVKEVLEDFNMAVFAVFEVTKNSNIFNSINTQGFFIILDVLDGFKP